MTCWNYICNSKQSSVINQTFLKKHLLFSWANIPKFELQSLMFFVWLLVLRLTIRLFVQSIQGQAFQRCVNHDMVVGHCSKLLMRLSNCIHLWIGKKLLAHMGIEPRSFQLWGVYFTPRHQSKKMYWNVWSGIFSSDYFSINPLTALFPSNLSVRPGQRVADRPIIFGRIEFSFVQLLI